MSDEVHLPNIQEYVSIKEAAERLGLAYKTVHEYVTEGRIRAVRASDVILIPIDEIRNFKPNLSGRPRKSVPAWRISPEENTLLMTSIHVQMRAGQQATFMQRLEEMKQSREHTFPGTVARYITGHYPLPTTVVITLIWRSTVMPSEIEREQALEAFKQALADVLDWDTAQEQTEKVFMHT